ncbi:short-chain dehydrogenase [Saccharobesus litoralis]|uniref:Short-chain dehydrogenase n=1 Tax=Saccharobesus litoralis TaxID=2172099 RepID=A0A2S0VQ19_9ALTE|nr:SDR family NAD(P)-dependent oxidoreductase [Saccharobesus litoralis]AWB66180.1 short-chain dehydrogenase [Saccharobesus litoralis]
MTLINKQIVLTGGTAGIGFELAKKLAQNNQLIVLGRDNAQLEKFKADNPPLANNLIFIYCDLADLNSTIKAVEQIQQICTSLDLLINNAAIQYATTFLDTDYKLAQIQQEITINLTSVAILCHALLPLLQQSTHSNKQQLNHNHQPNQNQSQAIILNVNSGLAIAPKSQSAIYCATKAALNHFSLSLNYQLKNSQVKVQQCFLPVVDTNMTKNRAKDKGKISAVAAAKAIFQALTTNQTQIDIGKVKLLRIINRLSPSLAMKIMEKA